MGTADVDFVVDVVVDATVASGGEILESRSNCGGHFVPMVGRRVDDRGVVGTTHGDGSHSPPQVDRRVGRQFVLLLLLLFLSLCVCV